MVWEKGRTDQDWGKKGKICAATTSSTTIDDSETTSLSLSLDLFCFFLVLGINRCWCWFGNEVVMIWAVMMCLFGGRRRDGSSLRVRQ